jgi:SAM-dependent methyltransferase
MIYSQGIARYYDLFARAGTFEDEACDFLEPLAAPGTSLLEIGAGVGNTALALAARGVRVTALEPDAEMYSVLVSRLALRKELHGLVSPVPRAAGYPLRDRFDLCACFAVLHLLQPGERAALVAYAKQQVRRGGTLVLEMPMVSRARVAKPWSIVATVNLGSIRYEHHSAVESTGDNWWCTHWMYRVLDGDTVLDEVLQSFHWKPFTLEESERLIVAHGLVGGEEYGGFDRSAFVPHESRVRLVVAHLD